LGVDCSFFCGVSVVTIQAAASVLFFLYHWRMVGIEIEIFGRHEGAFLLVIETGKFFSTDHKFTGLLFEGSLVRFQMLL